MPYTMKEIAKLARVSQPTVSRVINGNQNVNPDIRKRVLKVIEEVGFQPNKAAQTLKNQNSNIIGVSVTSISNPYFIELIEAIELEARKIGYNILLHNCENNFLIERENLSNFIARQVDGAIVVPESNVNLGTLSTFHVPTIVLTAESEEFNSISISHEKGGTLAAEDFLNEGLTEFLYVGQGPLNKDAKLLGYSTAFHTNGIIFPEKNYIHHPTEVNNSIELAQIIEKQILMGCIKKNTTGILCGNDIIALQFITIALQNGYKLNQDYKLIGFDDTLLARSYGFSSIRQPIREMSTHAIQILLEVMNGKLATIHKIKLDPVLIKRNTLML
jgi:LacI family transcriptional regulator